MSLSGAASLAGVIGWPIAQSLSPALHGHWLEEYGIDGAYVPLPIRPEDFARSVDGLVRAGFKNIVSRGGHGVACAVSRGNCVICD